MANARAGLAGQAARSIPAGSLRLEHLAKERRQLFVLEKKRVVTVARFDLVALDVDSVHAESVDELPRLVRRVEPVARERRDERLPAADPAERIGEARVPFRGVVEIDCAQQIEVAVGVEPLDELPPLMLEVALDLEERP
jgi:hypothetical protein